MKKTLTSSVLTTVLLVTLTPIVVPTVQGEGIDHLAADEEVLWIDGQLNGTPNQLPVVKSFHVDGVSEAEGLAYDGEYLYVTSLLGGPVSYINKINPHAGVVVDQYQWTHSVSPRGIAWDGVKFYVSGFLGGPFSEGFEGTIHVLDADFALLQTLPAPTYTQRDLAYDGRNLLYMGDVYLGDLEKDRIWFLDPSDGSVKRSFVPGFSVPGDNIGLGLASDGRYIWTSTSEPGSGSIYKLDIYGTILEQYDSPESHEAAGLAFDGKYLWLVDSNSNFYRLDVGYGPPVPTVDILVDPNPSTWGGPLDIRLNLHNPGNGFDAKFRLFALESGTGTKLQDASRFLPSGFSLKDVSIFSVESLPQGLPHIIGFMAALYDAGSGELLDFDFEAVGVGVAPSTPEILALRQDAIEYLEQNGGAVNASPVRWE